MEYQYEVKMKQEENKWKLEKGSLIEAEISCSDDEGFYSDYGSDCDDDSDYDNYSESEASTFFSEITFDYAVDTDTLNLQMSEEEAYLAEKLPPLFQNYKEPVDQICEEELEQNRNRMKLEMRKASRKKKMGITKELNSAIYTDDEEKVNSIIISYITSTRCCKKECFMHLCQQNLNFSYPVEIVKICRNKVRNFGMKAKREFIREQLKLSNIKHNKDIKDNSHGGMLLLL